MMDLLRIMMIGIGSVVVPIIVVTGFLFVCVLIANIIYEWFEIISGR